MHFPSPRAHRTDDGDDDDDKEDNRDEYIDMSTSSKLGVHYAQSA